MNMKTERKIKKERKNKRKKEIEHLVNYLVRSKQTSEYKQRSLNASA